jgi:hypothetical protein
MGSLPTAVSLLLNRLRTDFVRGEDFGIKNFLDTGLHLALLFRSSLLNRFFTPKVPSSLLNWGLWDLTWICMAPKQKNSSWAGPQYQQAFEKSQGNVSG